MNSQEEDWGIQEGKEIVRRILPAGRYKCRLAQIKKLAVQKYAAPVGEMENKLLFEFIPEGIDLGDDELCSITSFVRPFSSPKSAMYKLLCSMSPDATVPDSVRSDVSKYRKFAESFIDKYFWVTSQPSKSNRNNILTGVMPILEEEKKEVKSGFEDYPDHNTKKEETAYEYFYDLRSLSEERAQKALKLLEKAEGQNIKDFYWKTNKEVPQLKAYICEPVENLTTFEEDDIPF